MLQYATIHNPKRTNTVNGHEGWYPYYAGYSAQFVSNILQTATLKSDAVIVDPWNGSGTTTTIAKGLGFETYGFDLNPVMVIAAKACLVSHFDTVSLKPLSKRISELALEFNNSSKNNEPLSVWFKTSSANFIRKIEKAIQKILVSDDKHHPIVYQTDFNNLSSIAAFFYVALFRTINLFLKKLRPTNPTWIKMPNDESNKENPSSKLISFTFLNEVAEMVELIKDSKVLNTRENLFEVNLASSSNLPIDSNSVDLILTSPPYCTRIDYAIATMPELTLLGYHPKTSLDSLRRNLIGASTVPSEAPDIDRRWGNTCNNFLEEVYNHQSKASKSYYFKSHAQYFKSIFDSVVELERVLKNDGECVFVIQDSHYKDVYNNLPQIFSEMANEVGLNLIREEKFPAQRNMAKRNPEVKKYRTQITANESVLCLKK